MPESYRALAEVYDRFTEDVDYDAVYAYLNTLLRRVGADPASVLDLACGTGSIALRFSADGKAVIGVDGSEDMLTQAAMKSYERDFPQRPLFVHQQMQQLRLPQPVDLCVCLLDSLNYLTNEADIQQTLRLVNEALTPGGWFILDIRTPNLLRSLDGQVFLDESEDAYCVWRGQFCEQSRILTYEIDLFTREGRLWRRSQEQHEELAIEPEDLCRWLESAGFDEIQRFGNRVLTPPTAEEERLFILARKHNE